MPATIAASANNAAADCRPADARADASSGLETFWAAVAIAYLIARKGLRRETRTPCFTSHAPRSCRSGRHCSYSSRSSATCLERRMCPASPQSITRCAMLMPGAGDVGPPAHIGHFAYRPAVNSHPHRNLGMLALSASAISSAHRAGSSALWRKTSAIPSPVGSLTSCSSVESRTCAVPSTIFVSWPRRSFCSSIRSLE